MIKTVTVSCRNMLERFITDELRAADKNVSKSKTDLCAVYTCIGGQKYVDS